MRMTVNLTWSMKISRMCFSALALSLQWKPQTALPPGLSCTRPAPSPRPSTPGHPAPHIVEPLQGCSLCQAGPSPPYAPQQSSMQPSRARSDTACPQVLLTPCWSLMVPVPWPTRQTMSGLRAPDLAWPLSVLRTGTGELASRWATVTQRPARLKAPYWCGHVGCGQEKLRPDVQAEEVAGCLSAW